MAAVQATCLHAVHKRRRTLLPCTRLPVCTQSARAHASALLTRQCSRMPPLAFLSIQRRKDAAQWLINVNAQYKYFRYHTETLFLAVNYMDRFLAKERLDRSARYYLLAMVSLALACKISEEFNDPLMEDMLMHLQSWQFTSKQIRQFERRLLSTLGYELAAVTPVEILYGYLNTPTMKSLLPLVASSSIHLPSLLRRHSMPKLQRSPPQCLNPLCTCSTCTAASLASSKFNEHWSHCCGQPPTIVMPIIRIAENYLIRCLPHYEFTAYQPSILAMAALNVALECIATSISLQTQQQFITTTTTTTSTTHLQNSKHLFTTQEAMFLSPSLPSLSLALSSQGVSLLKQNVIANTPLNICRNMQLPSPLPSPIYSTFPIGILPSLSSTATTTTTNHNHNYHSTQTTNNTTINAVPTTLSHMSSSLQQTLLQHPQQPPQAQYPQSLALGFIPSTFMVSFESQQLSTCMSRFLQLLTTDQALMILHQSQL